jgi:hypothetical protein
MERGRERPEVARSARTRSTLSKTADESEIEVNREAGLSNACERQASTGSAKGPWPGVC